MKVKYVVSKGLLLGSSLVAVPLLALGLMLHSGPDKAPPHAVGPDIPSPQATDSSLNPEHVIIRVIVLRRPAPPGKAP
jgi:hypothetical protein